MKSILLNPEQSLDGVHSRAVSPVVGLALLVGLTAVATVSLLVVGAAVVDDVGSTAERDQAESSMTAFADTANDAAVSDSSGEAFEFTGGERGTTWVNESAGSIEVVLVNGTEQRNLTRGDLGVYRHQTAGGTELAYQGGGVWRVTDGHAELIEPPAFDYREGNDEPTLTFSNVRIRGDVSETGAVGGKLQVAETEDAMANVSNPVVGDYLYIDVQSEYCSGWQTHVQQRTDGAIEEPCDVDGSETGLDELRINMSVAESHVDTTVETVPGSNETANDTVVNGTYGLYAEDEVILDGTGGTINGTIGAGENIEFSAATGYNQDGERIQNVTHEREPHDDRIDSLLANTTGEGRPLCYDVAGIDIWDCEYDAGTYRISDDSDGGGEVTFDVSDGNVTLVVPGDFETADTTEWTVEGHEDGGGVVRVYVDGDMTFTGSTRMGTPPGPGPEMDDPIENYPADPSAEALQFLGSSDTDLTITDTFQVEGKISAPSPGAATQSRAFAAESSSITFVGALHAGIVDISDASTDIYQDTTVATQEYVENGTSDGGNGTTYVNRTRTNPDEDLYYLHVSETVLEVED